MSESNAPFNRPGQPKSADIPSSWENPFPDVAAEGSSQDSEESRGIERLDYGSDDAAAGPSTPLSRAASAPASPGAAIAAWSEMVNPGSPPDLADLISLIQELNQCNSILLDRVSQLEDALEHSQKALQLEVGPLSSGAGFSADPAPENLAAAQTQIASLSNQLEFALQTNQRQQILVETLTNQVENGQERVAQLEREAALLQQRYNEQAQLLAQSENACRDLQARLQRQQRYTLQFKAALEKSLEVPTPQYEMSSEKPAALEEAALLPKAQRIQPWSSPSPFSSLRFPWMQADRQAVNNLEQNMPVEQPAGLETTDQPALSGPPVKQSRSKLARLKLPAIALPVEQDTFAEEPLLPLDIAEGSTPASHSLASADDAEVADPRLLQKLDAAVQPLADLLADVVLKGDIPAPADAAAQAPESDGLSPLDQASADELLKSVMTDAEDALWQDLARLMDGSTEDMVKASLSGDFNAFQAINFEAIQSEPAAEMPLDREEVKPEPKSQPLAEGASPQPTAAPVRKAKSILPPPMAVMQTQATSSSAPAVPPSPSHEADSEVIPALAANSGWPSPVVYPLRPTKKRQSPGTVDLPNFLRQEASDPLPT